MSQTTPPRTHWRKVLPTQYICGDDLVDSGPITAIMDHWQNERVKREDKEEIKAVLYFRTAAGRKVGKGLVLNATNAKTLAELYGPYLEDWLGKPITLYPVEVRAFGKTAMAVRMRRPPATAPQTQQHPDVDADTGEILDDDPTLDHDDIGDDTIGDE